MIKAPKEAIQKGVYTLKKPFSLARKGSILAVLITKINRPKSQDFIPLPPIAAGCDGGTGRYLHQCCSQISLGTGDEIAAEGTQLLNDVHRNSSPFLLVRSHAHRPK